MAKVAIIGGGVSGLSAAYYLSRASLPSVASIVVLEAGSRLGGWVHSRQCEDGAIFEFGPRTIRPYGKAGLNTLDLVDRLDLRDRFLPIARTHPAASKRFIYADGELHQLPGLKEVMSLRPTKPFSESMAKILVREAMRRYPDVEDESVHSFIAKHFGEDLANYVMNPLCRGVFAGKSSELSFKSCFGAPFDVAKQHGSIVRGLLKNSVQEMGKKLKGERVEETEAEKQLKERVKGTAVWTLKGGLQELTEAMTNKLLEDPRVEIRLNSPVSSILTSQSSSRVRLVTSQDGVVTSLDADHVISSIYAKDLAQTLREDVAFNDVSHHKENLADLLQGIPAVTVCVVNLEYIGDVLPFSGFGYLIPSFESGPFLGCVFDSCALPQHNARSWTPGKPSTRITVMIGGAWYEDFFGNPKDGVPLTTFEQMAIDGVRSHLKIEKTPCRTFVTLQKNCIPQYLVGHSSVLASIDASLAASRLPLSLVGSSFRGPAVNDCILNSKLEVESKLIPKFKDFRKEDVRLFDSQTRKVEEVERRKASDAC